MERGSGADIFHIEQSGSSPCCPGSPGRLPEIVSGTRRTWTG